MHLEDIFYHCRASGVILIDFPYKRVVIFPRRLEFFRLCNAAGHSTLCEERGMRSNLHETQGYGLFVFERVGMILKERRATTIERNAYKPFRFSGSIQATTRGWHATVATASGKWLTTVRLARISAGFSRKASISNDVGGSRKMHGKLHSRELSRI